MSISKRRYAKNTAILGVSYGTASARLQRAFLFSMAVALGMTRCFRCGKEITSVTEMSIDHKIAWKSAKNPVEAFFDLTNIALSHGLCNSNAAQKKILPHGASKGRVCKCEACIASRNVYNAEWMANWRAARKDKSRVNFKGS